MGLIKSKSELVFQPKIKMLIYGQAGVGKSTLALSAPKPLLLDCDGGVHRVNLDHIKDTVQVEKYEDVLEVLNENLSAYETIVIDTGGKLLDLMADYIISRNPKMGKKNGSLTLQGYGERKCEFSAFCKKVNSLNKHLVFVAHRQTEQDGDNYRYVPLFGGSNYDSLVTELDVVGYLETQGKIRTITFDPSDRNDGKNTCNLPSAIQLPITVDEQGNGLTNDFIEKGVINSYITRLNRAKELNKEYESLVAKICEDVKALDSAEKVNKFIAGMNTAYKHTGSSLQQTKTLVGKKVKELGLTYNKESKLYE